LHIILFYYLIWYFLLWNWALTKCLRKYLKFIGWRCSHCFKFILMSSLSSNLYTNSDFVGYKVFIFVWNSRMDMNINVVILKCMNQILRMDMNINDMNKTVYNLVWIIESLRFKWKHFQAYFAYGIQVS